MRKIRLILIILAAFACILAFNRISRAADNTAQTVTVTVEDIEQIDHSADVTMTVADVGTTPGNAPANPTSSATYLAYTSVVAAAATHKITAVKDVAAPAGISLMLHAEQSSMGTNEGTAAADQAIPTTPTAAVDVVTAIGSCATGTAASGVQLHYTAQIDTVTDLVAASTEMAVTFTMTAS